MTPIKQRLIAAYNEQASDYDPEETENVLIILEEYDDNLSGLSSVDYTLLTRLLDDEDLLDELEDIMEGGGSFPIHEEDPFE